MDEGSRNAIFISSASPKTDPRGVDLSVYKSLPVVHQGKGNLCNVHRKHTHIQANTVFVCVCVYLGGGGVKEGLALP